MLTVGDMFPAFSLQGINEKNEFVKVDIHESYDTTQKRLVSSLFLSEGLYLYLPNRNCGYGYINRTCKCGWYISGDNEFCKLAWKESNNGIIGNIQSYSCSRLWTTTQLMTLRYC